MIQLELPNCSRIYDLLLDEVLEEELEEDSEFFSPSIDMGPLELLDPLSHLTMRFMRQEDYYSSYIEINSRNQRCFLGHSSRLKEKLENRGHRFIPSSEDMTGYIMPSFRDVQTPIATITSSNKGLARICAYGYAGARTFLLDGPQSFRRETARLNDYAEAMLETLYKKSIFAQVLGTKLPTIKLKYPKI
jgi:hypothetical protein